MTTFIPRHATGADCKQILELYKRASVATVGLARASGEITESYITGFCSKAQQNGLQLVIENNGSDKIIAEIHCSKLEPKVFSHILSELTVVVDPDYQGQGLGTCIFKSLLAIVSSKRSDILRVELLARSSNIKAINLYQQLGFVIEGRLERRIKNEMNTFEADIPMAWFNKNYMLK